MGIGHVAVGLGLKRADPQNNAGWLIFAALLPDVLLGLFALAGWESFEAPSGYSSKHYLLFSFPWSHGLVAELIWATVAGLMAFAFGKGQRTAFVVAIAVVSHFVLDGIVHVKGLPLVAGGAPVFGLGLWRNLPLELLIEAGMAAAGLWIYRSVVNKYSPGRGTGMVTSTVVLTIFLMVGQATAVEVPPKGTLIASWLVGPPVIAGIAFWLDRRVA